MKAFLAILAALVLALSAEAAVGGGGVGGNQGGGGGGGATNVPDFDSADPGATNIFPQWDDAGSEVDWLSAPELSASIDADDNRNVATLAGTFTSSADPTVAAGRKYHVFNPGGASRDVTLVDPGTTGQQELVFINVGTAAGDILNFTNPDPDLEAGPASVTVAQWTVSEWLISTNALNAWLADATPLAPGTGAVGTATQAAREDHVHDYPRLVTASKSGNYTLGTDNANELYGGVIYVSGAATITVPAVATGASFTVITIGAVAVSVDVNAADRTVLDGTALSDGDQITNTSTAGDIAVFTHESASGWYAATNGWTDGN